MEKNKLYEKLVSQDFRGEQEKVIRAVKNLLFQCNEEADAGKGSRIYRISARIKSAESILEKLGKKHYEMDYEDGVNRLNDLAGIRAVCPRLDDVYAIRKQVLKSREVRVLKEKDYILCPKPTGYASLHLILEVPVRGERKRAELQIRTVAMDYWSSLEHKMVYKKGDKADRFVGKRLQSYAKILTKLDLRLLEYEKEETVSLLE